MMSTSISMTAGIEQNKVRPASGDLPSSQGGLEDAAFATSFNEGIAMSASSQGKHAADNVTTTMPCLKSTIVKTNPEQVAQILSGANKEPIEGQDCSLRVDLKHPSANKIVQPQMITVGGPGEKVTPENAKTNPAELLLDLKGSITSSVSSDPQAVGTADRDSGSNVKSADGDSPVVPVIPYSDSPVAQKEPGVGKKVIEGASLKNSAKAKEKVTGSTVQKSAKKIVDATVDVPKTVDRFKPVSEISAGSAISVAGQVDSPETALGRKIRKAADIASTGVSVVTKSSAVIPSFTVDSEVRKELASGAKASLTNNSAAPAATSDSSGYANTEMSSQKTNPAVMPIRSDGDSMPQAVRESAAVSLHSPGLAAAAVFLGNTSGGSASIKLPVEDVGFHSPGLAAGSREQYGVGVATQSVDGTPRMLASTPTSLEVGIQNGTHGWLKVRAEMTDGGVVNASVSAAASAGQEMLHRELPALNTYLQEEKIAVNAVVVHAAPSAAAGFDARSSSDPDGAGGQTAQRGNEGNEREQNL